jgi:hypothetical protein
MNHNLAHLHFAHATHAERVRSASGSARRRPRTSRALRRLFAPSLQPRAAW